MTRAASTALLALVSLLAIFHAGAGLDVVADYDPARCPLTLTSHIGGFEASRTFETPVEFFWGMTWELHMAPFDDTTITTVALTGVSGEQLVSITFEHQKSLLTVALESGESVEAPYANDEIIIARVTVEDKLHLSLSYAGEHWQVESPPVVAETPLVEPRPIVVEGYLISKVVLPLLKAPMQVALLEYFELSSRHGVAYRNNFAKSEELPIATQGNVIPCGRPRVLDVGHVPLNGGILHITGVNFGADDDSLVVSLWEVHDVAGTEFDTEYPEFRRFERCRNTEMVQEDVAISCELLEDFDPEDAAKKYAVLVERNDISLGESVGFELWPVIYHGAVVASATPVGTAGGTTTLDGIFYQSGEPVPDVTVWIGGVECTGATVVDTETVTCSAAGGVGRDLAVEVVYTAYHPDTVVGSWVEFSYAEPTVDSYGPVAPLAWDATTITLTGSNFGDSVAEVWVTVGDRECADPVMLTAHEEISCTLHPTISDHTTRPAGVFAVVNVAGQASNSLPVEFDAPPTVPTPDPGVITDVSARSLLGGRLKVFGTGFALFDESLLTVTLTGIDVECERPEVVSNNHLWCHVPPAWTIPESTRSNFPIGLLVQFGPDTVYPEYSPVPTESVFPSTGNVLWWVAAESGITYADASATAASMVHDTLGAGYLATPNSLDEAEYIRSLFPEREGWIGRVYDAAEFKFEWEGGPLAGSTPLFSGETDPFSVRTLPAYIQTDGTWITAQTTADLVGGFFVQFGQCGDGVCDSLVENCVYCSVDCPTCRENGLEMRIWSEGGWGSDEVEFVRLPQREPTLDGQLLPSGVLPFPEVHVQWSGHIQVPGDGVYVFELVVPSDTNGAVELFLNDELLLQTNSKASAFTDAATTFRTSSILLDRLHLHALIIRFVSHTFDPALGPQFAFNWALVDGTTVGEPTAVPYSHLFFVRDDGNVPTEYVSPWEGTYGVSSVRFSSLQDAAIVRRGIESTDVSFYTVTLSCALDEFDSSIAVAVTTNVVDICAATRFVPEPDASLLPVSIHYATHDAAAIDLTSVHDTGLEELLDRAGSTEWCASATIGTGESTWTFFQDPDDVADLSAFEIVGFVGEVNEDRTVSLLTSSDGVTFSAEATQTWLAGESLFSWRHTFGSPGVAAVRIVVDHSALTSPVCFAEAYMFTAYAHELQDCGCVNDGSYGSVCGLWGGECEQPWCYVDPSCSSISNTTAIGDRDGSYSKICQYEPVADTCDTALRLSHRDSTFHLNTMALSDSAYAPKSCNSALGHKGVWFRVAGIGELISVDTCAAESTFSSYITVLSPTGDNHCECLDCVDDVAYERVSCDNGYTSHVASFTAELDQWYYIFVSGGVSHDEVNYFTETGRGLVGLNIVGRITEWDDGISFFLPGPRPFTDTTQYTTSGGSIICAIGYELYYYDTDGNECTVDSDGVTACEGTLTSECVDIDECETGDHSCPQNSCVNTEGSYYCDCTSPYTVDPNDPQVCLDNVEAHTAWELLEKKRKQQLANELSREEQYTKDGATKLEAELRYEQLATEQAALHHRQDHEIAFLTAWVMQAELYARYADAAVPPLPGLPNIGYLAAGYDPFSGYPATFFGIDPGFRVNPLDMQYGVVRVTGDARFALPDNVHAVLAPSSQFESQSSIVSTEEEYRKDLDRSLSYEVGGSLSYNSLAAKGTISAQYSASEEYQETTESFNSQETYFVQVTASVTSYTAKLSDPTPTELHPKFREMVENLDASCQVSSSYDSVTCDGAESLEDYMTLLDTFGPFYTTEVTMGGRAFERFEMTVTEMRTMTDSAQSSTTDVSGSGSFSKGPAKIEIFGSRKTAKSITSHARQYAREQSSTRKEWFLGGQASAGTSDDGSTDSLRRWATTVDDNPVPISYKLAAITSLMTETQFPDDDEIELKRTTFESLLYLYCIRQGGTRCGELIGQGIATDGALAYGDYVHIDQILGAGVESAAAGTDDTNERILRMYTKQDVDSSGKISYPAAMGYLEDDTLYDESGNAVSSSTFQASPVDDVENTVCYCSPLSTGSAEDVIWTVGIDDDDTDNIIKLYVESWSGQTPRHIGQERLDDDDATYVKTSTIPKSFEFYRTGPFPEDPIHFAGFHFTLGSSESTSIRDVTFTWRGVTCTIPNMEGSIAKSSTKSSGSFYCDKTAAYEDPCADLYRADPVQTADCFADECEEYALAAYASGRSCAAYMAWDHPDVSGNPTCFAYDGDPESEVEVLCVASTDDKPFFETSATAVGGSEVSTEVIGSEIGAYFKLTSPVSLENSLKSTIVYGSPIILTSSYGGMAVTSSAVFGSRIMEAIVGVYIDDSTNQIAFNEDIEYVGFRFIPVDESRYGQPVLSEDTVIIQIISGLYSISYDELNIALLHPEGTASSGETRYPAYPTAQVALTQEEVVEQDNFWVVSVVPNSRPDAASIVSTATRPSVAITDVQLDDRAGGDPAYFIYVSVDPADAVKHDKRSWTQLKPSAFILTALTACDGTEIDAAPQATPYEPDDGTSIELLMEPTLQDPDNGLYVLRYTWDSLLDKGNCLHLEPQYIVDPEESEELDIEKTRHAYDSDFELPYIGEHVTASFLFQNSSGSVWAYFEFPHPVVDSVDANLRYSADSFYFSDISVAPVDCTVRRFNLARADDAELDTFYTNAAAGTLDHSTLTNEVFTSPTSKVTSFFVNCPDPGSALDLRFNGYSSYGYHEDVGWDDENTNLQNYISDNSNQFELFSV